MFLGMIKQAATTMVEYETSDIPDRKLMGFEERLIFDGMVENPKLYDKLVKRIKREGYALEDRPFHGRSLDAALTWPDYKREKLEKPVIFRSDLTRRKKNPWVLAHELGHQYHLKKGPAGYAFGVFPPVAMTTSTILGLLTVLGMAGRRTAMVGAGLGAAGYLGVLIREAKATANAKKIIQELSNKDERVPPEMYKAYGTYVLGALPVLLNLISVLKGGKRLSPTIPV